MGGGESACKVGDSSTCTYPNGTFTGVECAGDQCCCTRVDNRSGCVAGTKSICPSASKAFVLKNQCGHPKNYDCTTAIASEDPVHVIIFITIAVLAVVVVVLCIVMVARARQRQAHDSQRFNSMDSEPICESVQRHEIDEHDLEFGDTLGKGGFATVYVTTWQGSKVAAKCFALHGLNDNKRSVLKRSFRREAEVAFDLRSPRVVSVFGICTTVPDHLYIIMELAEGGSVRAKLEAAGRVPLEHRELWGIARDAALGMKYLHIHDIVHRDFKSHNVLLDSQGGAKVADFGTAGATGQLQEMTTGSRAGTLIGTVGWMAPEAIDGEAVFASDVFSFGIFLWELATRRMPWEGETLAPIIFKVCFQHVRPSTDSITTDGHYKALPAICTLCWAHAPDDRPTFDELERESLAQFETPGLELPMTFPPPAPPRILKGIEEVSSSDAPAQEVEAVETRSYGGISLPLLAD